MPDYGHPLRFATFPEPVHRPPDAAVRLALLSERLGYDMVMFQDHPYQSGYLDVWTLMAWVAARTSRLTIATNVINVAMRPPAMVAKSAASLDLLSGGRFELGLGAGYFWDAMTTMGVPRRSPGQAFEALVEAVEVIRGTWGERGPAPVTINGVHYRLDGMRPGPVPAHRLGIWLGGYRPRMLGLIGRVADGWTATIGPVMSWQQWRTANAIIDEAAAGAGRDPADIRRIAGITGRFTETKEGGSPSGPPAQWVEQLLPRVLDDGVDTFLLATGDITTIERFAAEVIPALRDATARERRDQATAST